MLVLSDVYDKKKQKKMFRRVERGNIKKYFRKFQKAFIIRNKGTKQNQKKFIVWEYWNA